MGKLNSLGKEPRREAIAAHLGSESWNRHSDADLIQPKFVGALGADSDIRAAQQNPAHCQRMACDRKHNRS